MTTPRRLAFDLSSNTLFVAETELGRISQITADGTVSTFATGLSRPTNIAFSNPVILGDVTAVPEPSTYGLVGTIALGGLIALRRRNRCGPF